MSDWVQIHTDRLRSKLQEVVDGVPAGQKQQQQPTTTERGGLRVPWSWACRSAISLATNCRVLCWRKVPFWIGVYSRSVLNKLEGRRFKLGGWA